MSSYRIIQGDMFSDTRGELRFYNGFGMQQVCRFYEIAPANHQIFRAWQGHRSEKKWFRCVQGTCTIYLIKLDTFTAPSPDLVPEKIELQAAASEILEVPGGYASGIRSTEDPCRILVFSDFTLEQSTTDDFRYPPGQWNIKH